MITIEHLSKIYPKSITPALNDVTLTIKKGELCVLVGPSGCGKTTLLRTINRLIEPLSGTIKIDGKDILSLDVIELRRNIGYVIQEIGLFPNMTIAENVAVVPTLLGWKKNMIKRRVEELLDLVGLAPDEYSRKYPRQLSGGQRQRVGVARALGIDPPILLMDEPLGAIDPITKKNLQNEFLRIQKTLKKTIVFVTHDLDEALKMGDHIVIMRNGAVVQHASPYQLIINPADAFVREFIGLNKPFQHLASILVSNLLNNKCAEINSNMSCSQAITFLREQNADFGFVSTTDGRPSAYFNVEDIGPTEGPVIKSMHKVTEIMPMETNLEEVLIHMIAKQISTVCIQDQHTRQVGFIKMSSVYEFLKKTP